MAAHLLLEGVDLSTAPVNTFIIEIGSVREPQPLPSSLYLCEKAKEFGMSFLTVDASATCLELARQYVGDKAILADGKQFLQEFDGSISVLYLDNFDYPSNESHFNAISSRSRNFYKGESWKSMQRRSANTHVEQFLTALPKLTSPCWVIVDDTGRRRPFGRAIHPFWGKGQRVVPYAIKRDFAIVKEGLGGIMLSRSSKRPSRVLKFLYLYCGLGRMKTIYKLLGYRAPDLTSNPYLSRSR
jgi:hypothetical protein